MTNELKTQIDKWLQSDTPTKNEIQELNVSLKDGEAIYKLTMSLKLNWNGQSKIVTTSRLFPTFAQNDTSANSKGDIYLFNKIVDRLEKAFFDEYEKVITELTGL